jgi:hypothetical protein
VKTIKFKNGGFVIVGIKDSKKKGLLSVWFTPQSEPAQAEYVYPCGKTRSLSLDSPKWKELDKLGKQLACQPLFKY